MISISVLSVIKKDYDEIQMLYVDNGIAVGEELEQLKTINSLFVEF